MKQGVVTLGGELELRCLVPETVTEYRKGLEGLSGLTDSEGMLFRYGPPAREIFIHMAGVTFPIDVLFLRGDAVVGVVHEIQPGQKGRVGSFADMALEVAGGWCARHYVGPGTVASLVGLT